MKKMKKFVFFKRLIFRMIFFFNFVTKNYCEKNEHNRNKCCPECNKFKLDEKRDEFVFINLPEKIEDYNENLINEIKNKITEKNKDEDKIKKITLENLKNLVKNDIEMIKNRTYKEYKEEDLYLCIFYIIKDNDLIASKIMISNYFGNNFYNTEISKKNLYDSHSYYPFIKKSNIDYWFENYFKEGVYSFDKLKEFWNKYNPTYLTIYKKYPLFYFEKNETNRKYFENFEDSENKK